MHKKKNFKSIIKRNNNNIHSYNKLTLTFLFLQTKQREAVTSLRLQYSYYFMKEGHAYYFVSYRQNKR